MSTITEDNLVEQLTLQWLKGEDYIHGKELIHRKNTLKRECPPKCVKINKAKTGGGHHGKEV